MNPLKLEHNEKKKKFSSRSVARAVAIQGVFLAGTPHRDFLNTFLAPLVKTGKHELFGDEEFYSLDTTFTCRIVSGVQENMEDLCDVVTSALSKSRDIADLEEVSRSIVLCGAWELKYATENPVPVIIYEYIEWAKHFLPTDGHGFVHGVLDKITPFLRNS